MKKIALIPARYAATRFPFKLMQPLAGKSVIRHTYENTLATNLFEMAPIINSIKDNLITEDALSSRTLQLMKEKFSVFIEDILGLQEEAIEDKEILKSAMQLLMDIRKEARDKKDFVTSDIIRKRLTEIGIQLKDEKDGKMSWSL